MCNHSKNFEIIEIMHASHARRAVDAKPDELDQYGRPLGYNEIEDIQHYYFVCTDCGIKRKFKSLSVEKPAFIRAAVAVLFP